jgi:hypothetical protein
MRDPVGPGALKEESMIVPIIMAIWFGFRASKTGRNAIGWAIGGAALSFAMATLFANLGVLLVSGSLRPRMELQTYMAVRIVTAVLAIVATIILGQVLLRPQAPVPLETAAVEEPPAAAPEPTDKDPVQ